MFGWPDSGWLKLFDLDDGIIISLTLSGTLALFLYNQQSVLVSNIPLWVIFLVLITTFIFTIMLATKSVSLASKEAERFIMLLKHKNHAKKSLSNINDDEREILSYLIQKNMQHFNAELGGRQFSTLEQKGLIIRLSGIGYEIEHWPHKIPDHIWIKLKNSVEDFDTANLDGPHPWRTPWGTR